MARSRRFWRASASACLRAASAATAATLRSSSVSARSTWPVVMPLLTLISVRARSTAEAGSASPQTRRPPSSQQ